jgi:hypothetical protein
MRNGTNRILGVVFLALAISSVAHAQSVTVAVPPAVSFFVTNVSISTIGSPDPATLSYSSASIPAGQTLRFSVMADASTFTPPAGAGIPSSRVSWTTANAIGGTGTSGTLSSSAWSLIFQSTTSPSSGRVDLTFTLAPPAVPIVSGAHTLTMRWKIESM